VGRLSAAPVSMSNHDVITIRMMSHITSAQLSVNHCILALKVMPHTLFVGFCAITYRLICD